MNKNEYRSATDIKTEDEARGLLTKTRIIFWVVFLGTMVSRFFIQSFEGGAIFLIPYFALLVYLVIHCMKVIKLTRHVTKAEAIWAIFFAPISWFWLYPELTRPLKIIIGDITPPEKFPDPALKIAINKEGNRRFWKTMKIVVGVSIIVFIVAIGLLIFISTQSSKSSDSIKSSRATQDKYSDSGITSSSTKSNFQYSSLNDEFEMDFPTQPSRRSEKSDDLTLNNSVETITYEASWNDAIYYLFVVNYANDSMSDTNPDFDVDGALEGALNGMANTYKDGEIVSQRKTTIELRPAIKYKLSTQGEILEGFVTYDGTRLYTGMVEYVSENTPTSPSVDKFLSTFSFLSTGTPIAE